MNANLKKVFYVVAVGAAVVLLLSCRRAPDFAPTSLPKRSGTRYILYWTPSWARSDFDIGFGRNPFKHCKYKNCYATANRTLMPLEKFDLLLFHASYHLNHSFQLPWIRSSHQRYLLGNYEAPPNYCPDLKPWNSYFNWTMTYRFDSEIVRRYGGFISKRPSKYTVLSKAAFKNKTKLAAWFVSHCNTSSKRELLAKELQKYMDVDIYGKCGTLKCASQGRMWGDDCYKMIEREYKFYLSFENSFCKDYTTEKLYFLLAKNTVPVVYGYQASAPPNSFINVADFDSAHSLASYLKEVAADYKEYVKYFEWKQWYHDSVGGSLACQICTKLNEPLTTSIYHNMHEWWWGPNNEHCRIGRDLPKIVSDLL